MIRRATSNPYCAEDTCASAPTERDGMCRIHSAYQVHEGPLSAEGQQHIRDVALIVDARERAAEYLERHPMPDPAEVSFSGPDWDALCARVGVEHGAARDAAWGIWRAEFFHAIGHDGYVPGE